MRKGCDGGRTGEKKTDGNSGHYVIASSQPPKRQPLEHRTLVTKYLVVSGFILDGGMGPLGWIFNGGTVPSIFLLNRGTVNPGCILNGGTVALFNIY